MGFLLDLLFGAFAGGGPKSSKANDSFGGYDDSIDGHDSYFRQVHNDAMAGDPAAIDEMRNEFGDGWEGEY